MKDSSPILRQEDPTADVLLFDFDGTLCESGLSVIYGICRTTEHFGIHLTDTAGFFNCIGPTSRSTFSSAFGLSSKDLDLVIQLYRTAFREEGIHRIALYPGIAEMLYMLCEAGKTSAIATSKPMPYTVQIAAHFGILNWFVCVSGDRLDGKRSDKTSVIRKALLELTLNGAELNRCIMVGDRKYDVIGAAEVGIPCMGISYGYGSRAELLATDAVLGCRFRRRTPHRPFVVAIYLRDIIGYKNTACQRKLA